VTALPEEVRALATWEQAALQAAAGGEPPAGTSPAQGT